MERGLFVVLEANETERELFREAAAYSAGHSAPLDVLRLVSPEDVESVDSVDVTSDIDRQDFVDPADHRFEAEVEAFIADAIDDPGDYDVRLEIAERGDRAEAVFDVAEDRGVDHVFLAGKRRSPTGKALFGDLTQEIILNFDGTITLSMD
ncbi:UpsA domain-containing protein [Halorhabdus tiamatea SARL4B]|uniref:Universal stress protein A (UpsA) domain protein n=1 Tax=Halorhabdus tiamatea SARL4B TaxID=1033806 RepID=F7PGE2_9EURY|nr:universal stress protein [Halorhabdus tiamatea]ERJ04952.1 UpsA domain-containing protein [Halorhabdus tiamatea SARL4B]CCQ33831.1 universal stress protein A (UpsA) domain protein [Halorhabdus tiamatea SARL4B]